MKKDPLTGEEFEPRRSNQRFARPENRIKYYNNKAKARRQKNAYIDKILKHNQEVLDELMEGKDEATFHEQFLKGAKFNPNVCTGITRIGSDMVSVLYNYLINYKNPEIHVLRNDKP